MARRPSRAQAEAGPRLDERGQALSALLPSVLQGVDASFGTALDEVTVLVEPGDVAEVCRIAREDPALDFDYLRSLSVVDYVERLEVSYHLLSLGKRHKMVVKANLPPDAPRVPTVTGVWRGANWYEREGHDLFGVLFEGHPDLSPLLLYDGFEGHPGLRSFPFHEYDEW